MHVSGCGGNNEVGRYIACFYRMRNLFTMLKMPLVHEETHLKFYTSDVPSLLYGFVIWRGRRLVVVLVVWCGVVRAAEIRFLGIK